MKLKIARAFFWLVIGLSVLLVFVVVHALLTVIDNCLGWVNHRFDGA